MGVALQPATASEGQIPDEVAERTAPRRRGGRRFKIDPLLALIGLALLLVGVVRPFVAEPLFVPTSSMSPTLMPGDHVLAWKLAYRLGEVERGDLAVLTDPEGGRDALIKRVAGLPGDTIEIQDGVLFVNGSARAEPYVDYDRVDSFYFGPVAIPAGQIFVMGDDRSNSRDSRDFGPVPLDSVQGNVVARVWPPDRIEGSQANAVLAAD